MQRLTARLLLLFAIAAGSLVPLGLEATPQPCTRCCRRKCGAFVSRIEGIGRPLGSRQGMLRTRLRPRRQHLKQRSPDGDRRQLRPICQRADSRFRRGLSRAVQLSPSTPAALLRGSPSPDIRSDRPRTLITAASGWRAWTAPDPKIRFDVYTSTNWGTHAPELSISYFCIARCGSCCGCGSVRGVIHDPQHRPVQGAMVMMKAKASQWASTMNSDAAGNFAFNAVPLGEYEVTVVGVGF